MQVIIKQENKPTSGSLATVALAAALLISSAGVSAPAMAAESSAGASATRDFSGSPHAKRVAMPVKISAKPAAKKKAAAKSASGKINAWELSQSSKFVGPVKCLIADNAVRIRADKMGITWLFKAPKWDAYMYNTETRNYCTFPYDVWKNKMFFVPAARTQDQKARIKQFKVTKSGKKQQIAGQTAVELAIQNVSTGKQAGSIWMSSGISAPKQFGEVIGSMVNVPIETGGAPLKVMMKQKTGDIKPVLETSAIARKPVETKLFEPMSGYHKVKDEMALLFADSMDTGDGDLLAPRKKKKRSR